MAKIYSFRRSRLEVTAEVDDLIFRFDSIGNGEMYVSLEGKGYFGCYSAPDGLDFVSLRAAAADWMKANFPKYKAGELLARND